MTLHDVARSPNVEKPPEVPTVLSLWRGHVRPRKPFHQKPWRQIADETLAPYGLTFEEAFNGRRNRKFSRPRFAVMHALRSEEHWLRDGPRWSYPQIAEFLGFKDHTSIMNGVARHEEIMRAPKPEPKRLLLERMLGHG